jgi:hypothetical protein
MSEQSDAPGAFWREILQRTADAFADAFTPDAVLESSITNAPVRGAAAIRSFFRATGSFYDSIAFTGEIAGSTTVYLEWSGEAFGDPVAGITAISRDAAGKIDSVRLHHRPLKMVVRFSHELDNVLRAEMPADGVSPT